MAMNIWMLVSIFLLLVLIGAVVWYLYFRKSDEVTSSVETPGPVPSAMFTVNQSRTSAIVTMISPASGYIIIVNKSTGQPTSVQKITSSSPVTVSGLYASTEYVAVIIDPTYNYIGSQTFTTYSQASSPSPAT